MPQTRSATRRQCELPEDIDDVYAIMNKDTIDNNVEIPLGQLRNNIFIASTGFGVGLKRLRNAYPRAAHFAPSYHKSVEFDVADEYHFVVSANGAVMCVVDATSALDVDATWEWLYTHVLQAFKQ